MALEDVLQALVVELENEHTVAIGLTGSHARGDAMRYSDLDIWHFVDAMPDAPYAGYTLRQHDDYLVSVTTSTLESQRAKLARADGALSAAPGLRQMRVLLDKTGQLAQLIQAAHDFRWETVQAQAQAAASHELLGLAEEAHKIMNGLAQAEDYLVLTGLYGLVLGLTHAVALHNGVLADTENVYFRQVQLATGAESDWTRQHRTALGLVMASPTMRAQAGLRLYRETAALLNSVILPEHEAVIESTLKRLARFVG